MTKSFNKIIIVGRLGIDPEISTKNKAQRESDISQQPDFAYFTILNSTIDQFGNETSKSYDINAFGKQAMLCHDYLHKGDLCCVEGRLDRQPCVLNGNETLKTVIIAEHITFLPRTKHSKEASGDKDA